MIRPWMDVVNDPEYMSLSQEEKDLIAQRWIQAVSETYPEVDTDALSSLQAQVLSVSTPAQGETPSPAYLFPETLTTPPEALAAPQEETRQVSPETIAPPPQQEYQPVTQGPERTESPFVRPPEDFTRAPQIVEGEVQGPTPLGGTVPPGVEDFLKSKEQAEEQIPLPQEYQEIVQTPVKGIGDAVERIAKLAGLGLFQTFGRVVGLEGMEELTRAQEELLPPEGDPTRNVVLGLSQALKTLGMLGIAWPLVGFTGGALLVAGVYGIDQYKATLEEAKEQGKDPEDMNVQTAAILNGVTEAGIGFLSDMLAGKLIGLVGAKHLITDPIKAEVRSFSEQAVRFVTNLLKNTGKVELTQIPEEMLTNGLQDIFNQYAGLQSIGFWEAAKQAVMPTFWSGMLFGITGTMAQQMAGRRYAEELTKKIDLDSVARLEEVSRDISEAKKNGQTDPENITETISSVSHTLDTLYDKAVTDENIPVYPIIYDDADLSGGRKVIGDRIVDAHGNPIQPVRLTPDILEKVFPGVEFSRVGPYGEKIRGVSSMGYEFSITQPATITINPQQYEAVFGEPPPKDRIIVGAWLRDGHMIALAKYADLHTLAHEAFHLFQTIFYTRDEYTSLIEYFAKKPFESLTLKEHKAAREAAADAFADWKVDQIEKPVEASLFSRIVERTREFLRGILGTYTPEDLFRIASRRSFLGRKPFQGAHELYAPRVSLAEKQKRIPGAPPHIKTRQEYDSAIREGVELLKKLPKEYFYFYEDAGRAARLLSKRPQVREALYRTFAIASKGNSLENNVLDAVPKMVSYLMGNRNAVVGRFADRLENILSPEKFTEDIDGVGKKVYNFYLTIKRAGEGLFVDPLSVVDRWMRKYFRYPGSPDTAITPAQYLFMDGAIKDMARVLNEELGTDFAHWNIQSALWTHTMISDGTIGREVLMSDLLRAVRLSSPTDLFPGEDINILPPDKRQDAFRELQSVVYTPQGESRILKALGFPPDFSSEGYIAQGKNISPNIIASYITARESKGRGQGYVDGWHTIEHFRTLSIANGYIFDQDTVGYYKFAKKSEIRSLGKRGASLVRNAYQVRRTDGQELTFNDYKSIMGKIWAVNPDINATLDNGSVIFIDWGKTDFREVSKAIGYAIEKSDKKLSVTEHQVIGELITNEKAEVYNAQEGDETQDGRRRQESSFGAILRNKLTPDQFQQIDSIRMDVAQKLQDLKERHRGEINLELGLGEAELATLPTEELKVSPEVERMAQEKYAGSLNLPRFTPWQDIKRVASMIYLSNKDAIDKHRRVNTSMTEIARMAKGLGWTVEDVAKFKAGTALNAEQMWALISLNKWAVSELTAAAKKYQASKDPRDLARVSALGAISSSVMRAYQGAASEWGRVGAVLSEAQYVMQAASSGAPKRVSQAIKLINKLGGEKVLKEKAQLIANLAGDPNITDSEMIALLRDILPVKKTSVLHAIYVNFLLSGPKTHVVNSLSNTGMLIGAIPTKVVAGMFDAVRSTATGSERQIYAREGWEYACGVLQAIPDAFRIALKTLRDGHSAWGGEGKLETLSGRPLAKVSKVIPLPTDVLQAMDDFFKTLVFRGQANSLIYRNFVKTGRLLDFNDVTERRGLGDEIYNLSLREATYRTFQEMSRLADWLSGEPTGLLKWVLPFKRTLINVVKVGMEFSPVELGLNIAGKTVRSVSLTEAEKTEQLAKAAMGSAVMMVGFILASNGLLTGGGPKDEAERENLYLTGWRPYTVKTPFGILDYSRLDPLTSVLGIIADVYDLIQYSKTTTESFDEVIMRGLHIVSNNITNKTMFLGMAKFLNAVVSPERYSAPWWERFLASMVPGVVAALARAEDPTLRRPSNVIEAIKMRIPGMGDGVMPVYDRWGEVVAPSASTTWLQRLISPAPIYDDGYVYDIDRVIQEKGLRIGRFRPELTVGNLKIKLLPEEVEIIAAARQLAREHLEMISDVLEDLDPYDAERMIRSVMDRYDSVARKQLMATERISQAVIEAAEMPERRRVVK